MYRITGPELGWLEKNADRSPNDLLIRFFRYRGRTIPPTIRKAERQRVLFELISSLHEDIASVIVFPPPNKPTPPYFRPELLAKFSPDKRLAHGQLGILLRDLLRGFTDSELQHVEAAVHTEHRELAVEARKQLRANTSALRRAKRAKRDTTVVALQENETILRALLQELLGMVPRAIASNRLQSRESGRRMPGLSLMRDLNEPLRRMRWRLHFASPARHEMPLRFLTRIPMPTWTKIVRRAEGGAARDVLVDLFCSEESLKKIVLGIPELDDTLEKYGMPSRTMETRQLVEAWSAGLHYVASLAAVALTEGRIWDLGEVLNRRNFRIYRKEIGPRGFPRYFAYTWDAQSRRYKRDVSKNLLSSGKELLRRTRLGGLFSEELRSFLVEEHADYRNPLMHGRNAGETTQHDTSLSALCCHATLLEIVAICEKRLKA